MTMTIDISPEEEARLKEDAARREKTPDDLLRTVLKTPLGSDSADSPSWSKSAGLFDYPLAGEDAQAWVTRTQREGDEQRERALQGEKSLCQTGILFQFFLQGVYHAMKTPDQIKMPTQPAEEPTPLYEPMTLADVDENETEEEEWAAWQALSYRTLWEIWDNESDAIYDTF